MLADESDVTLFANAARLANLSDTLLGLDVPIVLIKLGDQGLYLRTGDDVTWLSNRAAWRDFNWPAWKNRELLAPCFDVEVVGTTGAGDCTIAGFLMAMLQGQGPEAAIRTAASVGARCVQSADATSNIPTWSENECAMQKRPSQREPNISMPGWRFSPDLGVYFGPEDAVLR